MRFTPAPFARALASLVILASLAHGATKYYDTSSSSGFPNNANFTWNTSTAQWGNSSGNTAPVAWVNANLDDARLGNGSGNSTYTATLGTSITVGQILRQNGTWNIALGSNTLTFNSETNWTFGGTGYGIISGTGNIVKEGSNTLTISTANSYSGVTTINAGVLSVTSIANAGSNSSLGNTNNNANRLVINGGTLRYSGSSNASTNRRFTLGTNGGTIEASQSSGTLTFSATDNVTLAGTNQARTLTLGGTSTANNTFNLGLTNNGTGATSLVKSGNGTWVLGGTAKSYTGGTTVSQGTLKIGANNMLADTGALTVSGGTFDLQSFNDTVGAVTLSSGSIIGSGTLTSNTSFAVTNTSGTATISARLGGTGALTKSGNGTLVLSGNNTYSGGTTLTAGTLRVTSNATALGTGTLTLSGGALQLANNSGLSFGRNTTVTGNTTITSDRLSSGAGVTHTLGTLSIGGQTLSITRGTNATSGTGGITFGATTLTGNSTFNVGSNALLTLGALNDGGAARTLTKSGNGTLTLGAAATSLVNGTAINITAGTLNSNNATALGSLSNVTLSSGATLGLGASQTLGGLNGAGGSVTLGSNTLTIGNATNNLNSTFAGTISGTGNLTKAGNGTLTLSGSNSYSGVTTITSGVLSVTSLTNGNSNSGIGASNNNANRLIINGGTLRYAGSTNASTNRRFTLGTSGGTIEASQSSGALIFSATDAVTFQGSNTARTLTLGGTSTANNEFRLGLANNGSGATSLVKTGTGTWVLSGTAKTYTGGTTVNEGTLKLGNNNMLADSGALTINSGTFDVSNYSDTVGAVTLNGGTIAGTGTLTGSSYTLQGGTVTANLGGTGTATVTSGTTTLNGTLGSSTININSGTLALGNNDRLNNSAAINIAGGTLAMGTRNDTVGAVTLSSGSITGTTGTLTGSSYSVTNNTGTTTISAKLGGSGALTKTGAGTLALSGANTYTGATTINGGTIRTDAANSLSSASAVTLADTSGVTLDLNGFNQTIGSLAGGGTTGGNVTLGSATLTAGGNNTSTTFGGTMTGTGGFTKTGSGTLTITNSLGYTGATTINNNSTLQLGNGSTSGNLTGTSGVTNNGTLAFNQAADTTFAAAITGSGNVTVSGTGRTILTNTGNSYSGNTTINSGATLQLGNGVSNGNLTGTNLTNNGTLAFNQGTDTTFNRTITGSGAVTVSGPGKTTLTANNTYNGATTINLGATLELGGSSGNLSNTSSITNNGLFIFNQSSSTNFNKSISGSGGVTFAGSGTVTLSAAQNYTGTTTINNGSTLTLSGSGRLHDSGSVVVDGTWNLASVSDTIGSLSGSGSVTLGSATLTTSTSADTAFSGTISGSGGSLVKTGSGTLTLTGANTYTGTTTISGGTLQIGDGGTTGSIASTSIVNNANLAINRSDTVAYGGTISGSGSLTKLGAGNLTLTGNNTYSGNTTVSEGAIIAGSTNALGAGGSTFVENGATLALQGGLTFSSESELHLDGLGVGGWAGALLNLSGNNTWQGNIILDSTALISNWAGALQVGNASNTLSLGANTLHVTAGTGTSIEIGADITGTGTLIAGYTGYDGSVTLSGPTTFSGFTGIASSTLTLGHALALQNSTLLYDNYGGALSFGSLSNATLGALSGSQNLALQNDSLGAVALTVGNNDASTLYSGALSGSGSLTKTGTGTFTLSGANTYTGTTTINNGTLTLDGAGVLSNPDIVVNATTPGTTATFALADSATQTINSLTFGGAGATSSSTNNVSLGANSVLTLDGNVTYLSTNNPLGSTISGPGTLSLGDSQRTFDIGNSANATNDLTISSNISGTGSILKTGTGTLALSGSNNTFSGGVTIDQGTLLAVGTTAEGGFKTLGDYSGVVVPTTIVTVNNGATLAVQNTTPGFVMPEQYLTYDLRTISLSGHGADGQGALQSFGGRNSWVGHTSLAGDTTIQNHVGGNDNTLFLGTFTQIPNNRFELNDHALTFIGAGDVFIASSVGKSTGDTGSLTVNLTNGGYGEGVNSITLAGAQNFYTGETRVDNGWLRLMIDAGNHPNAAVLGSLTIGDGIGGANTAVVTNYYIEQIADDVAVTIKSDGLLDLASASVNETLSNITLQGGRITTGTGNLYMTGTIKAETAATSTIDGNIGMLNAGGGPARIFDVDADSTLLLNARIFGGDYNKTGDGRMIVTVDSLSNGYSGVTTVQDGILTLRHSAGLGQHNNGAASSGTVVESGATLQLEQVTLPAGTTLLQGSYAPSGGSELSSNVTLLSNTTYNINVASEALTLAGSGHNGQGALQNLSGNNSWTNATITLSDSATINTTAGSLTIGGRIGSTAGAGQTQTLTVTGAGNTAITGSIKDNIGPAPTYTDLHIGTIDLVKNGSGTLTLSGVNTFTGAININQGTLAVTANNSLASHTNAVTVQSGATFSLSGGNNYTNTIGRLEGTGVVSIASATVLKVDNSTANTFDGRLTGQGLFDKVGSGTFTFSSTGNNNAFHFDGTVRLSNGTLEFAGGSGVLNTSIDALFIDTLELTGGTLLLSEAFINIGTLNITGDTILDFGATGHSILNADNIYIAAGATLTIRNWTSEVDFLFANYDFRQVDENGTLAIFNQIGTTPQNQVHFEGDPQSPDGSHTTWINYGYDGFTNWEIRPIPEPSTYGAILTAASLAFLLYRRSRKAKLKS